MESFPAVGTEALEDALTPAVAMAVVVPLTAALTGLAVTEASTAAALSEVSSASATTEVRLLPLTIRGDLVGLTASASDLSVVRSVVIKVALVSIPFSMIA